MERIKIYNWLTSQWDIYEGDFTSPSYNNEIEFDFDTDKYVNASGDFKLMIFRKDQNGNWIEIGSTAQTTIYESSATGGYIQVDKNGFIANYAGENKVEITNTGTVKIKGEINAVTGQIAGWTIVGSTIKSQDNNIVLDAANNKITVNGTDVEISSANGIKANKGVIGGWDINTGNISANSGTIKLTGGASPKIEVGSNIVLDSTKLSISNGAIDIKTAANSVSIDSTGIKATKSVNEYAKLDASGLTVAGGAINITTAENGNKKLTINSSGITAQIDSSNRVEIAGDGVKCIKNGNVVGSAITPDGLIGQLLTDQSVSGSKFDKTPPTTPTVQLERTFIEQLASNEFVNIEIKFTPSTEEDREGYKIYIKEGEYTDSTYFVPVAVLKKDDGTLQKYIIRGVKPATKYTIASTCFDVTGNESQIVQNKCITVTTPSDTIAPAPVDSITAVSGLKTIAVYWPKVTKNWDQTTQTKNGDCYDLDYYVIERKVGNGNYEFIGITYGTSFIDRNVEYDTKYRYRVIPQDTSGNRPKNAQSNYIYAESIEVEPSRVGQDDIVARSIVSEHLAIGSIVKSINTKETTLFHFDGTLMSSQGLTPYIEIDENGNKISHQSGFFKKEAKFGASLSIEEDTTNLIAVATGGNANLKQSTLGWNLAGNATYVQYDGVDGIEDGYININGIGSASVDNVNVIVDQQNGTKYTLSIYAKNNMDNSSVKVAYNPMINGLYGRWWAKTVSTYNVLDEQVQPSYETVHGAIDFTDYNPNGLADDYNCVIEGYIMPLYSEAYTLYLSGDDGVRLYFEDNLVINAWRNQGFTTYSYTTPVLEANKKYKIRIEHYEHGGEERLKFEWQSASQTRTVIPQNRMFTPYIDILNKQVTEKWERYVSTFKIPKIFNTNTISLKIYSPSTNNKISIDSVQLEQREYATSFTNGTKSEGYVDYYAPAVINPTEGTIGFWIKSIIGWYNVVDNDHPDDSPYVDNWFICGKENDTNNKHIYAKYNRENRTLTIKYGTSTINYVFDNTKILNDDWVHFAYSWKNGSQNLYINGQKVASDNKPAITEFSDKLFRLGYFPRINSGTIIEEYQQGGNKRARASALFDELRIDKVIRDENEIKTWFNQDTAFYDAAAQIDADTQNISAANASVTINNEGITVKDGKIAVESKDGKILLKDGRLQVNGLDVGVPQSDNEVYNGNFTLTDNTYNMCDCYIYSSGIARFGIKDWMIKRSSAPIKEVVDITTAWNNITARSYFSESYLKSILITSIDQTVRNIAKLDVAGYVAFMLENAINSDSTGVLKPYFTANPSHKTICITVIVNTINPVYDATTKSDSTINTEIQNALTSQGISNAIVIATCQTLAVEMNKQTTKDMFIEYQVAKAIKYGTPNDPIVQQSALDVCQAVSRQAINSYIDNYAYDGASYIQTQLMTQLVGKVNLADANSNGIPDEMELLIGITIGVYDLFKEQVKTYIEYTIDNNVNATYDEIVKYKFGILQYNDQNGTLMTKILYISNDDKYYEMNIDILKWFNIDDIIDTSTMSIKKGNEFVPGGTSIKMYPSDVLYGRKGYIEMSVDGINEEYVEIYQDLNRLTLYTDDRETGEKYFKQHTVGFNVVYNKNQYGQALKGQNSKVIFEVEELVPNKPIMRDPVTGVPYLDMNLNPVKGNYVIYNGEIVKTPSISIKTFNNTNIDMYLLVNTFGSQYIGLGNASIDIETYSYSINSLKDVYTMYSVIYPAPGIADGPYNHPTYGPGYVVSNIYLKSRTDGDYIHPKLGKGYVKNGIWYKDVSTSQNANNTPSFRIENSTIITDKVGDFILLGFNIYSDCDTEITIRQSPQNGIVPIVVDFKELRIGDLSYPQEKDYVFKINGFKSGNHTIMAINSGIAGVSTTSDKPSMMIKACEIYDWEPLYYNGEKMTNIVEYEGNAVNNFDTVYIMPNKSNSVNASGVPILPKKTPVKLKVKIKLYKSATSQSEKTSIFVTGIQCELGTNPSYHRLSYGEYSIPGTMIQKYSKEMWLTSGIKSNQIEDYLEWYPGETGIQNRHIANKQITSNKIANSSILNSHIADSNITFEKTRIKKINITDKTDIAIDDYIPKDLSQVEKDMYLSSLRKYTKVLVNTSQNVLIVPGIVAKDSEFVIKNGQILNEEDDYTMQLSLAFVKASDLFEIAKIYGVASDPERLLTQSELNNLIALINSIDFYTDRDKYYSIAKYNVLFCTKIILNNNPSTVNGYRDKYKIQFWEAI